MPEAATQKNRLLAIGTALGEEALLITSFSMTETMGRLFQMDVELLSTNRAVNFDLMVGSNATVRLRTPGGGSRYFNGFISRFGQMQAGHEYTQYRATLVPWLWFLTRTSDCRIFQKKKVPDIIEEVFKAHGFNDFKLKLSGTYREWEYCVQYRESDFAFVSRLMEQEGIYYFFTHEDGVHTLNLADAPAAHEPFGDYGTIRYMPVGDPEDERITDWIIEKEVQSGIYALSDFNFKNPAAPILVNANVSRSHEAAGFEIYDYPGEFDKRDEGETYAKVRIQELQSQHEILRGQATVRGICPGSKFTMERHSRGDQNREYLITSASYQAIEGGYRTGDEEQDNFFACNFTAIPASEPYRSARTTPRPIIQGPQTAIVVGKKGEEIDTDEFGRVKVQFHWDRYGKVDENSSCWVRVSQAWAGKSWGAIYIPRIGQEVIVEFLEGDPDRPIITGRVYNATAKVPYDLPANKTMSTFKSNSSKGGAGFNEFRFEDKKGEEQVFLHAEKNQDIRIKNDTYEWIGNERHLIIVKDQFEQVKGDLHETVDGENKISITKDRHLKITGKNAVDVGDKFSLTVKGDMVEVFKANHSEQTTQNYYLKAMAVVIEASSGVTLKCGGNSVVIDASGVTVKGSIVTIDGSLVKIASGPGSPAASGSAGSADAPASPTAPKEAAKADPGKVDAAEAAPVAGKPVSHSPVKVAGYAPPPPAAPASASEEQEEGKTWYEFQVLDAAGKPRKNEPLRVTLKNGQMLDKKTDNNGVVRIENMTEGDVLRAELTGRGQDEWGHLSTGERQGQAAPPGPTNT